MANTKNEHVSQNGEKWVIRREGSKRISRLLENKKDALEYASIIALNDRGFVVVHKQNGQFKNFKQGKEVYIRTHRIASIITGVAEITPLIVN